MEWNFACNGIFTSLFTHSRYLLLCVCGSLDGASLIVSLDNLLLTVGSSSSVDAPEAANKSALKLATRKEKNKAIVNLKTGRFDNIDSAVIISSGNKAVQN